MAKDSIRPLPLNFSKQADLDVEHWLWGGAPSDRETYLMNALYLTARHKEICPFCSSRLRMESAPYHEMPQYGFPIEIFQCYKCGWSMRYLNEDGTWEALVVTVELLRDVQITTNDYPLEAAIFELIQNWELVLFLHPNKLEELVAAVIRGHFAAEVRWVGSTGDRGIDVIAIMADKPTAIQIKRRSKKGAAEGVQAIREFCGALVLEGFREGYFVTTAERYTKAATETAKMAVERNVVDQFKLIDSSMLCDMFKLVCCNQEKYQKGFLNPKF